MSPSPCGFQSLTVTGYTSPRQLTSDPRCPVTGQVLSPRPPPPSRGSVSSGSVAGGVIVAGRSPISVPRAASWS